MEKTKAANQRKNYFIEKSFQTKFIFKFCLLLVLAGLVYMFVQSRIEKRGGAGDTPKPVDRTTARLAAKRK